MKHITFQDIKKNKEFQSYIQKGDELLGVMKYT